MDIGYVDTDAADSYFNERIYSDAWIDADPEDQANALNTAYILLDSQMAWRGSPTVSGQEKAWPRSGIDGIDQDAVPNSVMLAQMELALALLKQDLTALPDTAGFKSIQVDKIRLDVEAGDRTGIIPDAVTAIVSHLGSPKFRRTTFEVTR
jgi:hypothetical protein